MPPFKTEKDKPFEDWPNVGEVLIDQKNGRRLTVTEVSPNSRLGRNVIGTLQDGRPYACDVPILLSTWERPN